MQAHVMTETAPDTKAVAALHALNGIPGRKDLSVVFQNYDDGVADVSLVWQQVREQVVNVLETLGFSTDDAAVLLEVFDGVIALNMTIWTTTTQRQLPLSELIKDASFQEGIGDSVATITNQFDQNAQLLANWQALISALLRAEIARLES